MGDRLFAWSNGGLQGDKMKPITQDAIAIVIIGFVAICFATGLAVILIFAKRLIFGG